MQADNSVPRQRGKEICKLLAIEFLLDRKIEIRDGHWRAIDQEVEELRIGASGFAAP